MRLITIPMSHYCEKARWGLDYAGIKFTEEAHLQVFHYRAVKPYSDLGLVPLLVTPSGAICDSQNILEYADKQLPAQNKLYPAEHKTEIAKLEDRFNNRLGVESRRWVYYRWQKAGPIKVLKVAAQKTPLWQRLLGPIALPFMILFINRHLSVTSQDVDAGLETIQQDFDFVSAQMADGRRFLCGDQFTAADLTFACMAAPVVLPKEYGIRLPTYDESPAAAKVDIDRFTQHPAGQYALKLFAEMRHRVEAA